MKVSTKNIHVDDQILHCSLFDPEPHKKVEGVCLFTHGQGDYSERYTEVLHPFTKHGIRCILFDLPGHGESPGKRGHVGNLSLIDHIIAKGLEMVGDLPYGIAGHSMGGLLTLRHLTLSLQGALPPPNYCWINSALLSPTENKSRNFIKLATILSKIHPKMRINTGTRPELCRTSSEKPLHETKSKSPNHQLISVGWGVELIKASQFVSENLPNIKSDIPLLYTQGGSDDICPDHIAEKFIKKLQFSNKTYKLFPEMRHETFAEPDRKSLFSTIDTWLNKQL